MADDPTLPPETGGLANAAAAVSAAGPIAPITAECGLDVAGKRLLGPEGEILLPALEFRLLEFFRRNPEAVLSREQLLDAVWGRDFDGTDRVVDQAVYWLRRAIEPDPARPRYLRTRRGPGYAYYPPPPRGPDTALT